MPLRIPIPIPIPIPRPIRLWKLNHYGQPAVTMSCLSAHYYRPASPQSRAMRGEAQVATGWRSMRESKRDEGRGRMANGDRVRSFFVPRSRFLLCLLQALYSLYLVLLCNVVFDRKLSHATPPPDLNPPPPQQSAASIHSLQGPGGRHAQFKSVVPLCAVIYIYPPETPCRACQAPSKSQNNLLRLGAKAVSRKIELLSCPRTDLRHCHLSLSLSVVTIGIRIALPRGWPSQHVVLVPEG